MAISATTGATASLSSAATSLAFAANTLTNGQRVVIGIAIANTSVSVSSITDGVNTYTLITAANNSSNVRVELWSGPVTAATGSRTITINFSGSTLASAAYEEYAGMTGLGNIGPSATGNTNIPDCAINTQDNGSWGVGAIAVATTSGQTFTGALLGTLRQSVIPALTTASIALVDVGPIQYPNTAFTVGTQMGSSAINQYAAAALELRTGVAALVVKGNKLGSEVVPKGPAYAQKGKPSYLVIGNNPSPIVQNLIGGSLGTAYSVTISVVNGTPPFTFAVSSGSLPTGTNLNSTTGVISGTPSVVGTYTFSIGVTDANGSLGTHTFQIIIAPPSSGGNTCVIY